MKQIDGKKINQLVESRDLGGIKGFLNEFMQQKLTVAEEGEVYAIILQAYMELTNEINRSYDQELTEILEILEPLFKMDRQVGDDLELTSIRDQLS